MSRDQWKNPPIDEETQETLERIARAIPQLPRDLEATLQSLQRLAKSPTVMKLQGFAPQFEAIRKCAQHFHGRVEISRDCKGWVRLIEILVAAQDDPEIKASRGPAEFLDKLHLIVKAVPINAGADAPLTSIYKEVESSKMADRASSSHDGRAKTKAFIERCFLDRQGQWSSIGEAAAELAPAAVDESKKYPRRLSGGNATNTVRRWLSEFVQVNPAAWAKLSQEAQERIEKARNR